jgi:hypothetical protein
MDRSAQAARHFGAADPQSHECPRDTYVNTDASLSRIRIIIVLIWPLIIITARYDIKRFQPHHPIIEDGHGCGFLRKMSGV